jgi:hypothetical protein
MGVAGFFCTGMAVGGLLVLVMAEIYKRQVMAQVISLIMYGRLATLEWMAERAWAQMSGDEKADLTLLREWWHERYEPEAQAELIRDMGRVAALQVRREIQTVAHNNEEQTCQH